MKINGKNVELFQPILLSEFLIKECFEINKVAVELNGNIVPRVKYAEVQISDEDLIEVVRMVGGG